MYKKFKSNLKKILKITQVRYILNTSLSFVTRYLIIFTLIDILNFNFKYFFFVAYFYVMIQSYFINKFFVFENPNSKFSIFLFTNIILSILEYYFSLHFKNIASLNYANSVLIVSIVIFSIRYAIYSKIIFQNS